MGGYIIYFSAAMYELYRNALVQHFECLQEDVDRNIRVTSKDSIDCSGSVVELLIQILPRNLQTQVHKKLIPHSIQGYG